LFILLEPLQPFGDREPASLHLITGENENRTSVTLFLKIPRVGCAGAAGSTSRSFHHSIRNLAATHHLHFSMYPARGFCRIDGPTFFSRLNVCQTPFTLLFINDDNLVMIRE
jgi:hypothetical protein